MEFAEVLHGTLRMATPLILAGLGGLFTHKANVLNIALDGMILIGAFAGVIASFITGSYLIGIVGAICASLAFGMLFNLFGVKLKGNFIITGLAVNIFATGLSSFILQVAFGQRGVFSNPNIVGASPIHIGVLEYVPIIGKILNDHTPMVYLSMAMIAVVYFVMNHTKYGTYVKAVGENEEAAKAMGLSIDRIRCSTVYISAILAALAGVNLALENLTMFVENMSNGRGFIALAAIFCGRGSVPGTVLFAILFGFADALQIRLQNLGTVPGSFIQMIPFLFIVVVLTGVGIYRTVGKLERGVECE